MRWLRVAGRPEAASTSPPRRRFTGISEYKRPRSLLLPSFLQNFAEAKSAVRSRSVAPLPKTTGLRQASGELAGLLSLRADGVEKTSPRSVNRSATLPIGGPSVFHGSGNARGTGSAVPPFHLQIFPTRRACLPPSKGVLSHISTRRSTSLRQECRRKGRAHSDHCSAAQFSRQVVMTGRRERRETCWPR